MSQTATRKYKVTLILDTRGLDQPLESLIESLTETATELGAQVHHAKDLGIKEFARVRDGSFDSAPFVEMSLDASPGFNTAFKEKLRLDRRVNRIFLESAE